MIDFPEVTVERTKRIFQADEKAARALAKKINDTIDDLFDRLKRTRQTGDETPKSFAESTILLGGLSEFAQLSVSDPNATTFAVSLPLIDSVVGERVVAEAHNDESSTADLAAKLFATEPWPVKKTSEQKTLAEVGYRLRSVRVMTTDLILLFKKLETT